MAVAIRTTGPDFRKDHLVELAAQPFLMDDTGRIVETGNLRSWREEPPHALSAAAQRLTGRGDHDYAGTALPEGEASSVLLDADFIVAANATYCRPFVHRRLPALTDKSWSSLLGDVIRQGSGMPGYGLCELANEIGCLPRDRLAETEVTTILHVIDHFGHVLRMSYGK